MAEVIEYGSIRESDGLEGGRPDDPSSDISTHPLDSEENLKLLVQMEQFWSEAREGQADNRREQFMDADYYDCHQWSDADAMVLEERGQAPLTFPLVKQMVDWVTGTERRTRIDWNVLPRKEEDVKPAQVKKEVLKFISDINGSGWERSRQFADMAKVGVGWTEECYNNDRFEEAVTHRYVDWKSMWWDPYSRDNTLKDCRYVHRAKWLDLDYAIAMCPDRAEKLRARSVTTLDPLSEVLELEASLPQMFYGTYNPMSHHTSGSLSMFGSGIASRGSRPRVLAVETWFKKAINVKLMIGDEDWHGKEYKADDADMKAAVDAGTVSLVDSVSEEIWFAIWTPGTLLVLKKSPYKHKKYPFTPGWGYRRHRDGQPYGLVRPARDPQDEYNKRRSKILYDLSSEKVIYESSSMDEADEDRNLEEAHRPDGEIRLKEGGSDKFRIERNTDVAQAQLAMLQEAKNNIYEASGVTRENTGQQSGGDQSGRAILAKQQQGAVTTAELFDNFRQASQESGQKTLSNCEQFLRMPKVYRITGQDGAMRWVAVNQPTYDPATGKVLWDNDITASEADFVIDQMDYRETVRMALAETLFEMLGRMDPQTALQLLDIAIDLTDLPNKQALASRIRNMTGNPAPGNEDSPEAVAQREAAEAEKQRQAQLAEADGMSKIRVNNAKAAKDEAIARKTTVEGRQTALDTAGMVAVAAPLAPAADRLWDGQPDPTPAPYVSAPPTT